MGSETQRLSNLCKDLSNSMPKHISAASNEVEPGTIETEITWETSTSKHFKTSFDVFVFSGDYSSIEKAEYRFHDLSNSEIGSGYSLQQSPDNNPSSVSQAIGQNNPENSSPESSPEASYDDSSAVPTTDYLWQEKAQRCQSIAIYPHSTLSPGRKYIALIRPTEELQSFYGAPFEFEIQYPTPRNVQVQKIGSQIHVNWYFPFSVNVQFRVLCKSAYDTHYKSVPLKHRQHSFTLDLGVLSEE